MITCLQLVEGSRVWVWSEGPTCFAEFCWPAAMIQMTYVWDR
jgi:hypothetical protein